MTKILNNKTLDDMQMHIEDSLKFVDEHLPVKYVGDVLDKLIKSGDNDITPGMIRNCKNKWVLNNTNLKILTALLEVAKESKRVKDTFIQASSGLNDI